MTLGLRNSAGKYLTLESFQHTLTTGSSVMKKKQIWAFEQNGDTVNIKSHQNSYLYVDGDGELKCDKSSADDECQFVIEPQADGKWALKSKKFGWYFKSPGPKCAFEAKMSAEHLWVVHLAMHPQVCLHNINRDTYVHYNEKKKTLSCDEIIPWGDDATITLFFDNATGNYGLQACTGEFLSAGGALSSAFGDDCKFVLEFHDNTVAFKSGNGRYITGLGPEGTLKASKNGVGKDELFLIEDSHPQIKLTSLNKLKLSIHGGVEVAANRKETTDDEIWQVEPLDSGKWTFKCRPDDEKQCYYWECKDDSLSATASNTNDANSHFEIEWLENQIAVKANNGKYLKQLPNGKIHATGASSDDEAAVFVWEMVNRPRLVLRGEYGFVGTLPSGLLECNKSTPEVYNMHITQGKCSISHDSTNKFWQVKSDGNLVCDGSSAMPFTMELHRESKMCLTYEGKYLSCSQNGHLTMTGKDANKATFFEY